MRWGRVKQQQLGEMLTDRCCEIKVSIISHFIKCNYTKISQLLHIHLLICISKLQNTPERASQHPLLQQGSPLIEISLGPGGHEGSTHV